MYNIGDKVRLRVSVCDIPVGVAGVVTNVCPMTDIFPVIVKFDGVGQNLPVRLTEIEPDVKQHTAKPRARRATQPVNVKVLKHLRDRGSISPVEAMAVYGISRLAPAIHDLRSAGYPITTKLSRDSTGKRYARYYLPKVA